MGCHRLLQASAIAAHVLNSCISWALEHRLNSCGVWASLLHSMWGLPTSGIEPMSPVLVGKFFTISTNGNPLQYSCLENPMGRGAWWAAVHGVTKSRTQLSNFTFTFHFHALEKETTTHSSVLAWRIPGMGEPGGLPFMGLHRVGHD